MEKICVNRGPAAPPAGYEFKYLTSIPSGGRVSIIQFVDETTGYALGKSCYKTWKSGKLWTRLSMSTPHWPRGMIFFDKNSGIITLENKFSCPPNCPEVCITLRTQDGGENWEEYIVPNLDGTLKNLQLDSLGNVYAFHSNANNANSTLMKSFDQGLTWQPLEEAQMRDLYPGFLKIINDQIYVMDVNQILLVLDTNGNLIKLMNTGGVSPTELEIFEKDHLILSSPYEIIRSDNGGETWETIHENPCRIVGFTSANNGIAIFSKYNCPQEYYSAEDVLAITEDGGQSWVESEYGSDILWDFVASKRVGSDRYLIFIGDLVYELKKE